MHDDTQLKTEVNCGFNLPTTYQAGNRQRDHMIAIASLIASVSVVTIIGAQIVGLI